MPTQVLDRATTIRWFVTIKIARIIAVFSPTFSQKFCGVSGLAKAVRRLAGELGLPESDPAS